MKKLSIIFFAVFMLSIFYSCTGNRAGSSGTEKGKATSEIIEKEQKSSEKHESKSSSGKVVHLTTQEFKEKVFNYDVNKNWKYEGTKPCIIDFYADWCRPCKMIAPTLEELAKEYKDQIVIYKVNTEKEKELAIAFQIQSIPTLLFIPVEGQAKVLKGALPKAKFKEAIEVILLKK